MIILFINPNGIICFVYNDLFDLIDVVCFIFEFCYKQLNPKDSEFNKMIYYLPL